MANPTATILRYIAGGRLYFTPYADGTYGTEIEIGEVKEFTLQNSVTNVEALSQDTGPETVVEDVVTKTDVQVSFATQNLNPDNRAMAHLGTLTAEVFAIGDTLPDGTTATAETTVDKIVGLGNTKLRGKLRVVSEPINDATKKPVLVVYLCSVRPSAAGDYIVTDYAQLKFEGKAQKTDSGVFDEYLMDVA